MCTIAGESIVSPHSGFHQDVSVSVRSAVPSRFFLLPGINNYYRSY